ncbi:MAG TPA: lysoplasmalogenase [Anaerolineae bacterium]|nr:lysoplasmalogenase [Anaerolineae bacterium]
MTSSAPTFSTISTRTKLLAVIGLAAALLYLAAGRMDDAYWLRMVAKPIPVLMLALWVSGLQVKGRYQLAIMIGLLLSALGDILLEFSDATFLLGLGAFLLGHVAYIVAFLQDSRKLHPFYGAASYAYGFLAAIFLMTTGNLGGMIGVVYLYILVITTMLWRAACRLDVPTVPRFSAWAGLAGALFFVVSDSVLAFRLFETPIQLGGAVVMVTYWLGQLGIALSAWRRGSL